MMVSDRIGMYIEITYRIMCERKEEKKIYSHANVCERGSKLKLCFEGAKKNCEQHSCDYAR
jgi:hypothetical protein